MCGTRRPKNEQLCTSYLIVLNSPLIPDLSASRDWIVSHPLVLPPAKLRALVSDEADSGVLNNIVEHPKVQLAVDKARAGRGTQG